MTLLLSGLLFFFGKILFVYRKSARVGEGAERGGERESQTDGPLSTEPDVELQLMTLRS